MLFWLGFLYCMGSYALKLLPHLPHFHVLNAESSPTCSVGILPLVFFLFCMEFRYSMMIAPWSLIFALWVSMKGQVAGIVFKAARPGSATVLASKRVMAFYNFTRCIFSVIWASRGLKNRLFNDSTSMQSIRSPPRVNESFSKKVNLDGIELLNQDPAMCYHRTAGLSRKGDSPVSLINPISSKR